MSAGKLLEDICEKFAAEFGEHSAVVSMLGEFLAEDYEEAPAPGHFERRREALKAAREHVAKAQGVSADRNRTLESVLSQELRVAEFLLKGSLA